MEQFYGAYVTTNGTQWLQNVAPYSSQCKEVFIEWYKTTSYLDVKVEYLPVTVEKAKM